jgi:hypothetical protein
MLAQKPFESTWEPILPRNAARSRATSLECKQKRKFFLEFAGLVDRRLDRLVGAHPERILKADSESPQGFSYAKSYKIERPKNWSLVGNWALEGMFPVSIFC